MSKMLEEIREQPAALERTLRSEFAVAEDLRKRLHGRPPRLVVLVARGTSDNAAVFGRYLIEITTGIPVCLAAPSVFTLYGAPVDLKDALVIAISQSGESTDTNAVLEQARQSGAVTVGISNEPSSSLTKLAEHMLFVRAGREESVAATKTYTSQLLVCYLLAYALGAPIERDQLARLSEHVNVALHMEREVRECSERFTFMNHAVTLARGLNFANSLEFSLKLMETCYVVAERFSTADLLHGPIAMLERSFPAFIFAPAGVTWPGLRSVLEKIRALRADTLVISDAANDEANRYSRNILHLSMNLAFEGKLPADVFTPIPYIVPAQLFAASLARHKGLDADRPRTLSKITRTL